MYVELTFMPMFNVRSGLSLYLDIWWCDKKYAART